MEFSVDAIRRSVIEELNREFETLDDLWTHLARWWCIHYKRPFRDPVVLEYTLDELLKEYLVVQYMENPDKLKQDSSEQGHLTVEEREDEEWFGRMERKYGVSRVTPEEQKRLIATGEAQIQAQLGHPDRSTETIPDEPIESSGDDGGFSLNWDQFKHE